MPKVKRLFNTCEYCMEPLPEGSTQPYHIGCKKLAEYNDREFLRNKMKLNGRKCRICKRPLKTGRYIWCKECETKNRINND